MMSKSFDWGFYRQLWMVTIINPCIIHSEYLFINKVQCKIFSFLQSFSWGNSNFEKHYHHSTKTIWPLLCFPIRYYSLIVMKRICLFFFFCYLSKEINQVLRPLLNFILLLSRDRADWVFITAGIFQQN